MPTPAFSPGAALPGVIVELSVRTWRISYKDGGYGLMASCSESFACTHYAELDIDALIAKLGADFDVVARHDELLAVLR